MKLETIFSHLKAALWDFDGVIADTEMLHYKTLADVLKSEGIEITREDYDKIYIHFGDEDAIKEAFVRNGKILSGEKQAHLMEEKAKAFGTYMPSVEVFDGVPETIQHFRGKDIPQVIVSGSLRHELETMLRAHNLLDFFVGVISAEDTERRKPNPEPYLAALRLLNGRGYSVRPTECLVVEDTDGGVQAGKAAGMRVLAVTNSLPAEKLRKAGADWIIDSLAAIIL